MNDVYISLGSNMGDKAETLKQAVQMLQSNPEVDVVNTSSIYETDPVGYTDQDLFLNMVVHVHTTLSALQMLEVCQEIEQELKRERLIRWGPRTIDLDILLYNHDNIETEKLIVPHERMHERAFVLVPLLEVTPNLYSPRTQESYQKMLQKIGRGGVRQWKNRSSLDF